MPSSNKPDLDPPRENSEVGSVEKHTGRDPTGRACLLDNFPQGRALGYFRLSFQDNKEKAPTLGDLRGHPENSPTPKGWELRTETKQAN